MEGTAAWSSADDVARALERERYVTDRGLAVTIFLALRLGKPLFLEGEAGVGKTEVAKVLASGLGRRRTRRAAWTSLRAGACRSRNNMASNS